MEKLGVGFAKNKGSFDRHVTRAIFFIITFISAQPRATFKGAAGRIWPAGRHLRRPALALILFITVNRQILPRPGPQRITILNLQTRLFLPLDY